MLAERYALIHQRILRHPLFRPTNLSSITGRSRTSNVKHKLTPIECLLGGGGERGHGDSVLLLGILIQIEEGQFYLEDQSGQVPIAFQESVAIDGFFVTEHCILLVEGVFQDGVLFVDRLGHPLQESRELSLQSIRQQVSHPAYLSPKVSKDFDSSTFVVLSDVHIDQPRILQELEGLFAKYENYDSHRMPCFILMGNFTSPTAHLPQQDRLYSMQQTVGHERTVSAIEELVTTIEKFPKLARRAHFCLVPGPNDYRVLGSAHLQTLPLPPLDKVMKSSLSGVIMNKNVRHLHLCSNPCRIRWAGQEIVVFRYDLLHLMQQNQVLLQQNQPQPQHDDVENSLSMDLDDNHHRLPHCRLVKTILDQGHLLPVPNVPVYWNFDSALRLYPLPDALILGGDAPTKAFHEVYGGCHVIHPGSFFGAGSVSTAGTVGSCYAEFTPGIHRTVTDDDPEDSLTQNKMSVEFLQVGE